MSGYVSIRSPLARRSLTARAAEVQHRLVAERESRAQDLARNDCQMWANLPDTAKDYYRWLADNE